MNNEIDASRRMGTSAFKKEINHLLHSRSPIENNIAIDTGWNSRDHALVMAMLLSRKGAYPKIITGKCMFIQGPYLKYNSIGVGQEHDYIGSHSWVVDPTFGLIDVSPILEIKKHRFRAAFDGIFGQVWLPRGKERVKVIVCNNPDTYEREIDKATHSTGQSTAIYMYLEETEITTHLIENPFKFLDSGISVEIKKRFGAAFYPAVAKYLQSFMLAKTASLTNIGEVEAWNVVFDKFSTQSE